MAVRRPLPLPLFLISLLFLLLNDLVSSDNEVPPEFSILLDFKKSLNSADRLSDWDPSRVPCASPPWTGIVCDGQGRVWGLKLEDMGLDGSIDVGSLTRLPNLRSISFMRNNFAGNLPDFSKLGSLKAVYLSHNRFSGEIGDGKFAGMASLKKLHLADNQLTGQIPASLAALPKLMELVLNQNRLEGGIPEFEPGRLKVFNVSNNKLSGEIPRSLRNLNASLFSENDLCGGPLDSCTSPTEILKHFPNLSQQHSTLSLGTTIVITVAAVLALVAFIGLIVVTILLLRQPNQAALSTNGGVDLERGHGIPSAGRQNPKLTFLNDDVQKFDIGVLLDASAELLGHGALGSAYKAALDGDRVMVVKRFKHMKGVNREEFGEHMRRLGRLSHPQVLSVLAFYYKKEEKLLVTEYLKHSSLEARLHGNRRSRSLDWPLRLSIVKGVAQGMDYLHRELPSLVVPHGHLKSTNVVLDGEWRPLLTDYGLIPVVSHDHARQHLVAYRSPECSHDRRKPTAKSDVWSFGLLILEVLTGKPQVGSCGDADLAKWIEAVMQKEGEAGAMQVVLDRSMTGTSHCQGEMARLLRIGLECCRKKPEERPEMREVVKMVEEVKERDGDDEFYSTYSTEVDIRSSRGLSEDFRSFQF